MADKQALPGAEAKTRKLLPNDEIVIGAAVERFCVKIAPPSSSSIHAIWSSESGSAIYTEGYRS